MYLFICQSTPPHFSHSSSKTQNDSSCPVCHAETHLVLESTTADEERGRISPDHNLSALQLFELSSDLMQRGYTEKGVAYILRLEVKDLRLLRNQINPGRES